MKLPRMTAGFAGVLLLAGLFSLLTSGCTLLGYGVGYSMDMTHAGLEPVTDLNELSGGDNLFVELWGDSSIADAVFEQISGERLTVGYRKNPHGSAGRSSWRTATLDTSEVRQVYLKRPGGSRRYLLAGAGFASDLLIATAIWVLRNLAIPMT